MTPGSEHLKRLLQQNVLISWCSVDVYMFHVFTVASLLESGVSPDLANEDGLTALHQVRKEPLFTITAERNCESIKCVLPSYAQVECSSYWGQYWYKCCL